MGFPAQIELSELNGSNGFAINGISVGDNLGSSVGGAGDMNGDGLDDLIIGASFVDSNGDDSGQSYVIFGSEQGFDPTLELADLNGTNGFTINGINESDRAGTSVSGAGDINGDGLDDLIIDAPTADPNGSNSGESYVVFGTDEGFASTLELASLNGINGFTVNGVIRRTSTGVILSGKRDVNEAGDINGDGLDDLIIGAPFVYSNGDNSGQSYVIFGSEQGFDPTLELADLNGTNGFTINGINESDRAGTSVSGAGDINGDGLDDLIIGAPFANPNDGRNYSGQSYVIFGSEQGFDPTLELADLDGNNGFVITGVAANDNSGYSLSGAGDINGDGLDDLIIGAFNANSNDGTRRVGQSYVVFGSDQGFNPIFELRALDGSDGFEITGIAAYDSSGMSVSGAGDINGDGFDDLIIGARRADPNGESSGQTYIVFGSDQGFNRNLELADLDGTNGFVLNGIAAYDSSGISVSGAGDVNGDGIADFIIGASGADSNGQSYVIFGQGIEPKNLRGTFGNDTLIGGLGNDTIQGLFGNDSLSGLEGDDFLNAAGGRDTLTGGSGEDTLTGGFGADWFLFNASDEGVDTITDFRARNDLIAVNQEEFNNFGNSLSLGSLPAELFAELDAVTPEAVFVYDSASGDLFYRSGNSISPESTQLASLRSGLRLSNSNFLVTEA